MVNVSKQSGLSGSGTDRLSSSAVSSHRHPHTPGPHAHLRSSPPCNTRTPPRTKAQGTSSGRGLVGGEERQRLSGTDSGWKTWGPYLSERAWGTVREDYSEHGDAWDHVSHDDARSRAFRWSEDGLGGICDASQVLCLAFAFWNGADPILKERIFGLTGTQGNHGEDAKEYWWYLDSTPTHSWMRWRYMYPQAEFPYTLLVEENARRGRDRPE